MIRQKKKIQSSIESLSVGDERRCFNQVRRASEYIQADTLLWNGMSAGPPPSDVYLITPFSALCSPFITKKILPRR